MPNRLFSHAAALGLRMLAACALLTAALAAPARADVTGTVRGVVTLAGAPRSGVPVTLHGADLSLETRTDARGAFAFVSVPFGRYVVEARAPEVPPVSSPVEVTSGGAASLTLALEPTAEIGRARASALTETPVSANELGRNEIRALPQSQSLQRLVETVPGVVRFSYDEPVAHGFHGVLYEVDGAPVPETSGTSFSQFLDPRNISSLEVFTGAIPAEFGGQRMGAVINIVTNPALVQKPQTMFAAGIGTYGSSTASLAEAVRVGPASVYLNLNAGRTNRALDAPSLDALHDAGSLADGFLRINVPLADRDRLSFSYSNQYNSYQVPINTSVTPQDAIVNLPSQDDVQREYRSFGNLSYTHVNEDGLGALQLTGWWRSARLVYAGDLAADLQALDFSDADCSPTPAPCALGGLSEDRRSTAFGLRSSYARTYGSHSVKFGIEGSVENVVNAGTIVVPGSDPFNDNVAQRGTGLAAYLQDAWSAGPRLNLQLGLRYDRSSGFVSGNLVQPRIGLNYRLDGASVLHAYYGQFYAAPALEDTRRDAVVIGGASTSGALPVYDLQPEKDVYGEVGLARTFANGLRAYVTAWQRNAANVLDTTQIFPTPLFATFNNAIGRAHGYELRLDQSVATVTWFLSAAYSNAVAGGISGGTFLFSPDALSDTSLQPEDHDQAVTVTAAYTKRFAPDRRTYVTVGGEYGTGYPVQFQQGPGRLPPHLTFDVAIGREPTPGHLGFTLSALNATDYRYLVKVNNGFNTTQWAPGAQVTFQVRAAL